MTDMVKEFIHNNFGEMKQYFCNQENAARTAHGYLENLLDGKLNNGISVEQYDTVMEFVLEDINFWSAMVKAVNDYYSYVISPVKSPVLRKPSAEKIAAIEDAAEFAAKYYANNVLHI
ncbi:MAG: hypothetical protein ACI3V4_04585 [Faecousia sp.]